MSGNRSGASQPQYNPEYHPGTPRSSHDSQAAICSGANFSIYVVRQLIGSGNTASVYRAHDTRLRREVALKVLNTRAVSGADGLARFLHEARMAAAVRHPNVVNIFDVGVHDATPYIVLELLTGEDLDTRLNAARVLREPALIDVAVQLVSGLCAVHDAGVVHRDLRPSNVFLARGPDGSTQPKLLDFSVSKQTRDNLRLTTNGRRHWAAMPLYTAPEVLLDGLATFHSDQYSLGVVLYESVTGVNPFRADTVSESIELITAGQARPIREQALRPSRRLAAVIEKAMHVYPDQRFADLHELGQALADLSSRRGPWPWSSRPGPSVARAATSRQSAPPRQAPLARAGRLSWALGVTVLCGSVAAPTLAWWSAHRQRARAPVSIAAPLVAGAASLPSAATPETRPCPAPCPEPSAVSPAPPGVSHAVAAMAPDSPTASEPEGPVAGSEAAEPPLDPLASDEAMLAGQASGLGLLESTAPALYGGDSGVAPPADGGALDNGEPIGLPGPGVAAPLRSHERGTNGALIFD
jgi:serine/threonine-protein kinase